MWERQFEGRALFLLLLQFQYSNRVIAIPLPDANIGERIVQIFDDKKVPHVADLKLPWE